MRSGFAIMLIIAILFGAGYWYYTAEAVCDVPISYRIGSIDERFDLTHEKARAAASVAESLWEDGTGRNLFTYDEEGEVVINFVYDERQEESEIEADLRDELDRREGMSESVKRQYEFLLEKYDDLRVDYERKKRQYEESLEAHNDEVERWNDAGGAPEDIYENLAARQLELKTEQEELNAIAYQLNQLVQQINAIGAEGNDLIEGYNEIVNEYNKRFNEEREFTQGDFQTSDINIYQFDSEEELRVVLAHEFGHALSLGHVEGEESIMYHFMEMQSLESGITLMDKAEFERVCGESSFSLWSVLGRDEV